ncbi:PREDICTED: uncharacterized protein LOC108774517 [Cyphomyrmex costatus]|nr:PREDICTED: uncharacterized protein LOC108774517 [Cyphomyrmex costatus]
MKTLVEFTCMMDLLSNIFICRTKNANIQHILKEIKNFLLASNDYERIVLQKYINRYAFMFISVIICYIITITTFCCTPAFTSRKFPSEGLYPFPTESPFVIFIIYTMQVCAIVQCGLSCGSMDFLFAAFFLYSSARLEMLCLEIQVTKNEKEINSCIKKHQKIIK